MDYAGNDSGFQRALARFKGHLSPAEQEEFRLTSLEDVQETIADIQESQGSERKMRNLVRIKGFLEAMDQYGKVVEVFLNTSDILAFVWGPIKFLLQEYSELFKQHAYMRKVLELLYGDILEFHRRALKFFSRPTWKQLFRSSWKNFRTQFQYLLSSLSRHKNLVESQASLVEYEQSKAARLIAQNSFEDIAKAERLRRFLAVTEKIHPPNTLTDHEGATETRQEYPESGKWILQHPSLRGWMDFTHPKTPILWVNGIPGAGKTVITSLIIEKMRSIDSVNVSFFYCKYNDDQKKEFVDVLRGILVQLVQQNEELLSYVYDACCSSSEVTINAPHLLKKLVETSLRSCPNTCIIIDGIDECEETEEEKIIRWFLAAFKNVTKDNEATMRLLFTSQRDKVTENLLTQAAAISLDSKYHQEDIQTYARHWSMKLQRKFAISEGSASQIGTDVAAQAQGLFLFANLVLMHLYSQTTREKLFRELRPDSFPTGLEAAYERIALRVFENPNRSEREDAHNIFRWIICAKRPLKWNDMQSVFAIDPDLQRVDFEERQLRVTCRELCGSLVETGAGGTLELVHRSAKLYLIQTSRISFRSEDLHIAEFCLDYLNFGCFDADLTNSEIQEFLRQGYYSFEDYAVAHWLDHVDSITSQPLPLDSISFEGLAQRLEAFFTKHGSRSPPDISIPTDKRFQSIRECDFIKRLNDLAYLARQRQSNEHHLNLETQLQRRRLVYEDIAANTDLHRESSQNLPLHNGSGWFKCPKIWCDFFFQGFQHKERRDKHVSQHERPFRCSFEECLYAKLGYGTEKELKRHEKTSHPTSQNSEWVFPTIKPRKHLDIFSASKSGDLATVQRLVGEGADVNQKTSPRGYVTPLYLAVKHNHIDIVSYLIEQGCDDGGERRIIEHAIKFSPIDLVKMLLLDLKEWLNVGMSRAQYALEIAASSQREDWDLILLLLNYGIDINYVYQSGKTALQVARESGNHTFARFLLGNGARDESLGIPWSSSPLAPDKLETFDFESFVLDPNSDFNFDPNRYSPLPTVDDLPTDDDVVERAAK